MKIRDSLVGAMALVSCWAAGAAVAGDAAAGKTFFDQQCAACHTAAANDNGGEQGPSLIGILGRRAGVGDAQFPYTQQLKDSKLTWDAATLDRFLNAPETVVPGTQMVIAVPAKSDRDNLIAYFQSVATASH